uniref:Protein kinase domain-containing protein n=1 Tax=Anopheles epiroticus TaxID=199890 RepID=A0A182P970_9DIPT
MHKVTTAPQQTVISKELPLVSKDYEHSSSDEDGYLSPFNGSDDGSGVAESGSLLDEMPPFSACSMSPSARSLSPIELEPFESPISTPPKSGRSYSGCSTPLYGTTTPPTHQHPAGGNSQPAEGYVTLDEIHARIGLTPPDGNVSRSRLNLETIFEGVFLETPPKKEFQPKGNLFRRSIRNRALLCENFELSDFLSVSTFFSGYDIIHQIGSGAYSEVFLVRCRKSGKAYAAKHLIDSCKDLMCDVAYAEIQLMKTVPSHPNVMQLCDHVLENKSLTLIMHLMDMSLYDYMQTRVRPFSENRVRKMLYQIVLGLEHLHQNGIFHRDVKPENILVKFSSGIVGKKETLLLADFGTAASIAQRPPYAIYIATRWYRAPECMLSLGYYGPKMDVWAVGCCFFEMLTLKPPFQGENEHEMLDSIHQTLGTPSSAVLERFKPWNVDNLKFSRRSGSGTGLQIHFPLMNAFGMDLLKRMLAYCPDQRISAKNLANHVYFEELM